MANGRRKRLEREIDRDARVTTSGYVHEVMAATLGQLQRVGLATRCPDPVALFDEVEDITRKFRSLHRRLNDARINRRGERDRNAPPRVELPPEVRPFAYHGAFLGAFPSVEAFAHAYLDPAQPEAWASYVDLTQAGIDLHLSGRYWTVDADGVTYAFAVDRERTPPPQARTLRVDRAGRAGGVEHDARDDPPPPRLEPERAYAALRAEGLDASAAADAMQHYVGRYVALGDHAWHDLHAAGMPAWMLAHTDVTAMIGDWCRAGVVTWVADPDGGVHVFAHGDPLQIRR